MDKLLSEFFDDGGAEIGRGSEEALIKAMSAGDGVNAAEFTGGRAMQPEDCESTLFNVMREQQSDFKLMNSLKTTPVKSTVRQYNVRTDVGEEDEGFVGEGEEAPVNFQEILRKNREMSFIQKMGAVTEQALTVDMFEDAFETEKFATTLSVLKTAEKFAFHGDSKVVPKQYDGLLAQIRDTNIGNRNVKDIRGRTITSEGEGIFTEMTEIIADRGGEANKVFYPYALGQEIQDFVRGRLRFGTADDGGKAAIVVKEYPTLFGSLEIAGALAGPSKMFRPKHIVKPRGEKGPAAPSAVVATAGAPIVGKSQFANTDAGNYTYEVFAVNEKGISAGLKATPVAVAAGDVISIEITPAAVNGGTGFIICRSAKGGAITMEMVRIARSIEATTIHVDYNDDLPGTAEMLFLTERKLQVVAEFFQLLPTRLYRRYSTNALVEPFVIALWGTPNLKAPHWCGVVKNIGYRGGLSYGG